MAPRWQLTLGPAVAICLLLAGAGPACAEAGVRSLEDEVEDYLEESVPEPAGIELFPLIRGGPIFEDITGRFRFRLRARALVDWYGAKSDDFGGDADENGALVRQARLGALGHVYKNVVYMLEVEFRNGSVRLMDIFLSLGGLGPIGSISVGHQRHPFSFDGVTPIPFHAFLERASSTRAFALGRDLGIRIHNYALDRRITWWVGVYRETTVSGAPAGEGGWALTGRFTWLALRDDERLLHLGFSSSVGDPADEMTRYRARAGPATGPRIVDTGNYPSDTSLRFSMVAMFRWLALVVQAEGFYAHDSGHGVNTDFAGAYVIVGYWLTGETQRFSEEGATWGRTRPSTPLHDGHGGRGAWNISLRYDWVDLTSGGIVGGEMEGLSLGVTWLWSGMMRTKLNLVYADVEDGPLGTGDIFYLMTRVQFDF